jgi:multiple sugar transport system permease protein
MLWMFWASVKQPGYGTSLDLVGPAQINLGPFEVPPAKPFLRFTLLRPGAMEVAVAGTFSGWTPVPMRNIPGGIFRHDIEAAPGRHEYKFVIDGKIWITDPKNPPPDPGGNSVIELAPDQPLAINHTGIRDRSYLEEGRLIPVLYAPDAAQVSFQISKGSPSTLHRDRPITTLERVNHGPHGETIPGAQCFTLESGTSLAPKGYSVTIQRSFGSRLSSLYTLENYLEVLRDPAFPFGIFFLNSLAVALGAALATTLICTLGGYAFAAKEFPGKTRIFQLCMASMMVPGMIYMVPQYAVVTRLGWINSYAAMIVPHLANIFGLLLMTNYIKGLPRSLFEAARVDGASEAQIIWNVLFPLSMPAMATLFVLTFMGQWSNFLWQLIVNTPDSAYRTLPVGLALFKGQYDLKVEAMMAAATFSVLPVSVVFFFTQKQLIAGLTSGSVKE